jgi:hypothetical protein
MLWFDSVSLQLYVRYADPNSVQWVPATNIAALSGDLPFLPLSGGTLHGDLTIGTGTGAPTLTLNGAAGQATGIYWKTAGTPRWQFTTDGSDNLNLYAFDAGSAYTGTAATFHNDGSLIVFNYKTLVSTNFSATAAGEVGGFEVSTHNNGEYAGIGMKIGYFGQSARNGFDTGLSCVALFDPPAPISGQNPAYEMAWFVAQSPNSSALWGCAIAEMNIVNRGPDAGFKRDRAEGGNNSGCLLAVPEVHTFGGTGGGEGKNATYAYSVARSADPNSTGFPAKFYTAFLAEPNCVVGQTGRAIYTTGDITGTPSQYPYGPMQTDGTWLHGIDHTKASYIDGAAQTMALGQALRWIAGPTTAPTSVATILASTQGLILAPASGGTAYIGQGSGTQSLTINGAGGQQNGINWQVASNTRWRLITDGSDNLNLYAYDPSTGGISPTGFQLGVPFSAGQVGFNSTAPITKRTGYGAPTGTATRATFATSSVTLPVLAEHVKALIDDLTAYGLIGP